MKRQHTIKGKESMNLRLQIIRVAYEKEDFSSRKNA